MTEIEQSRSVSIEHFRGSIGAADENKIRTKLRDAARHAVDEIEYAIVDALGMDR